MKDIKVREYVRSKKGEIVQCINKDETCNIFTFDKELNVGEHCSILYERELKIIKKHSFNLIDLIEVRRLCKRTQSCK